MSALQILPRKAQGGTDNPIPPQRSAGEVPAGRRGRRVQRRTVLKVEAVSRVQTVPLAARAPLRRIRATSPALRWGGM